MDVHTLFFMFRVTVTSFATQIQVPNEISTVRWMTIREADEKLIYYQQSLAELLKNRATYDYEGYVS